MPLQLLPKGLSSNRVAFSVDESWEREPTRPDTLALRNRNDNALVQITPMLFLTRMEDLRGSVEANAAVDVLSSVEVHLRVMELPDGVALKGYCYESTDRDCSPTGWRYKLSGVGAIGETVITFTVLSHTEYPRGTRAGLQLVLTASLVDSPR
jgi:hypothetical protein